MDKKSKWGAESGLVMKMLKKKIRITEKYLVTKKKRCNREKKKKEGWAERQDEGSTERVGHVAWTLQCWRVLNW